MNIVYALVFYLPLQEFLLKWLPVPDSLFFLLRQAGEMSVLALLGLIAVIRLSKPSESIKTSRAFLIILLFILWAVFISVMNTASNLAVNLAEIYSLVRFALLIPLVHMLNPTQKQISQAVRVISIVVGIQVAFGVVQFLGGIPVRDILAAKSYTNTFAGTEKLFTGTKFEDSNDLMGTLGDTISYAYIISVGIILAYHSRLAPKRRNVFLAILCMLLFLSGSRAAFMAVIMVITIDWTFNTSLKKKIIRLYLGAGVFTLTLYGLISYAATLDFEYGNFFSIFSSDIIAVLLNQRLGVLIYFAPELIASGDFILGLSPDRFYIANYATMHYENIPTMILLVFENVFEDIYWVALLSYYGLIGLSLWISGIFFAYREINFAQKEFPESANKTLWSTTTSIILLSFIFAFFNQAFESRSFAFLFWLLISLSLAAARQERRNRAEQVE